MSTIRQVAELLKKISTQDIRTEQDKKLHFVPINIEVLETLTSRLVTTKEQAKEIYSAGFGVPLEEVTDDMVEGDYISIPDFKKRLEDFIISRHQNTLEISGGQMLFNGKPFDAKIDSVNIKPTKVYENGKLVGALYSSYKKAYSGLFETFLNKELDKFINKTLYVSKRTPGFDVGHIVGNTKLAQTPLGTKLQTIINQLNSVSSFGVDAGYGRQYAPEIKQLQQRTQSLLFRLQQASAYGPKVEATITKDTRGLLTTLGANIVIIQDREENQGVYGNYIEGALSAELMDLLKDLPFSPTIAEDIEQKVLETFIHGKVISRGKRSTKKIAVAGGKLKPTTVTTQTSSTTKVSSKRAQPKPEAAFKDTPIKLQNLLNQKLVEIVKQNMGGGNRRDILNLRTGRFAESVQAQRVSQSRRGMISVFYSYMRNPYATFSAGGEQSRPSSRDPKLLISKSIRQIAAELMITNLRSIDS